MEDTALASFSFATVLLPSLQPAELTVVSEPVAKVDSRDIYLIEILSTGSSRHDHGEQGIFDVSMTP
jgi:hypothetical protein